MSPWPLHEDGTWREYALRRSSGPALFLDRDGVIVEETGYLHEPDKVRLVAGITDIMGRANARGVAVIVVTNQGGIGRGLFRWEDFAAVQVEIARRLSRAGVHWDGVLASPFGPGDSLMRKPRPGMLLAAATALGIDRAASWIIGDRETDIEAGHAAGLAGGFMVGDGYSRGERQRALGFGEPGPCYQVHAVSAPADAVAHLPFLVNSRVRHPDTPDHGPQALLRT